MSDCRVSWNTNLYTVPWRYVGHTVLVREFESGRLQIEIARIRRGVRRRDGKSTRTWSSANLRSMNRSRWEVMCNERSVTGSSGRRTTVGPGLEASCCRLAGVRGVGRRARGDLCRISPAFAGG
ncbi:Mu transposase domain-containing protein [Alicyclobacillus acidocaldarius]|uniref:Mu transposase domain-containing protein n=1 Tax=Alicyclobacillus acidocaldarius TaxID=405212 RepID=UPI00373AEDC4